MKVFKLLLSVALVSVLFTQCKKDMLKDDLGNKQADLPDAVPQSMFKVTVENVSTPYDYFATGVQAIPEGKDNAGPALPGDTYKFSFHAGPGHKLSFVTMYGWSNDGFFALGDGGIDLFDGDMPVTGDITSEIMLWDAGTEVNHEPGMNVVQGDNISDGMVQLMSVADNVHNYGTVAEHLKVTLDFEGNSMFTVTVDNLDGMIKTPISPIVWVIHQEGQHPVFTNGQMDYGDGLEDVAETGNPNNLSSYLEMNSGYDSPIAPGVWVIHHKGDKPIFKEDKTEYGEGLESLAEMGDPSGVYESLMEEGYIAGVYNTKVISTEGGPLMYGEMYSFTFEAHVGDYLSFASMLGKSNDLFFAPGENGIKLFEGTMPVTGDLTNQVLLWDAGTEVNEYPGLQTQANVEENGNVRFVDDGFPWPTPSKIIKVTIEMN